MKLIQVTKAFATEEQCSAPEETLVDKAKFERLLRKMLNTPPLPKSEVKVAIRNRRRLGNPLVVAEVVD
jgi:hypothetical protein